MTNTHPTPLESIETRLGVEWKAIRRARRAADEVAERLRSELVAVPSSDMSFVVFGSLARREWTSGSDLDWTLLIDGQVDPDHTALIRQASSILESLNYKRPGREGTFGNLAFSHPIVHQIGGETDTNRNITQRILLLSESLALSSREVHERVVRAVVRRYVEDDSSFDSIGSRPKAPRFLINDIVRYWRTVAVDFVYKQRDRGKDGWALRNLKLRMSRKLIFASGLLRCFLCSVEPTVCESTRESDRRVRAGEYLLRGIDTVPLELLALAVERFEIDLGTATEMFDAYDAFLAILDDADKRDRLEKLTPERYPSDAVFASGKQAAEAFNRALTRMFFESSTDLRELTIRYGVF